MSIEPTRAFNHLVPPHLNDPYPLFEELRREAPVVFNPTFGMWFVSRHEDVAAVVKDPVRFSSAQVLAPVQEPSPALLAILGKDQSCVYPLLSSDPPVHTRVRGLVSKAFAGPRVTATMEPFVREVTSELMGGLEKEGQAEMMARFATPLPIHVTSRIFGVPLSEMDQVKRWCDDETMFLMGFLPEEQRADLARSIVAYRDFLRALVEDHRARPRPDLVTELIEARVEGEGPLDTQELVGTLCVLIFAAHLTTTNMIGNTLASVLRTPGAWQRLRDQPERIPGALEEGMRFDAPVQGMTRTVTEDCQIGGVAVPRGARVFVLFGSANRDLPGVEDPDRFEIERAPGPNLAFGRGPHFCVGAQLARLEGRIALEELTRRLPNARLADDAPLSYLPNLVHRGPTALNIAWDAPSPAPMP
jgi:cytochrome P450